MHEESQVMTICELNTEMPLFVILGQGREAGEQVGIPLVGGRRTDNFWHVLDQLGQLLARHHHRQRLFVLVLDGGRQRQREERLLVLRGRLSLGGHFLALGDGFGVEVAVAAGDWTDQLLGLLAHEAAAVEPLCLLVGHEDARGVRPALLVHLAQLELVLGEQADAERPLSASLFSRFLLYPILSLARLL